MQITRFGLPALALGFAASFLTFTPEADGFSTLGFQLGVNQRDFRVFNNFTDAIANNNTTGHAQYPGAFGATLSIWKACVEWNSGSHGTGAGDPSQANLGDGGANFDTHFQGEIGVVGGINDNIHSELAGSSGGVLAFTESPSSNGWRIRYYSGWSWADGPGTNIGFGNMDLQGVACHEYGHALGLGHSNVNGTTMFASASGNGTSARSIAADDIAGIKAIYGVAVAGKPTITNVSVNGSQVTVTGTGFASTGNKIWFSEAGMDGQGARVSGLDSTNGGTTLTATIPATATIGGLIARNDINDGTSFTNTWPFDPGACPTINEYCTSGANSVSANGATIGISTSQSVAANDTVLSCFDLPANQNGIFYYGPNQVSQSFGEGTRCVGGTVTRLPVIQSDVFGFASYPLDLTNLPPGGDILSGSTWNFQFWYRDPAGGGAGFNLSGGLEVPFCD